MDFLNELFGSGSEMGELKRHQKVSIPDSVAGQHRRRDTVVTYAWCRPKKRSRSLVQAKNSRN
jgi:hypothetical protein